MAREVITDAADTSWERMTPSILISPGRFLPVVQIYAVVLSLSAKITRTACSLEQ